MQHHNFAKMAVLITCSPGEHRSFCKYCWWPIFFDGAVRPARVKHACFSFGGGIVVWQSKSLVWESLLKAQLRVARGRMANGVVRNSLQICMFQGPGMANKEAWALTWILASDFSPSNQVGLITLKTFREAKVDWHRQDRCVQAESCGPGGSCSHSYLFSDLFSRICACTVWLKYIKLVIFVA